jgi:hypothetical protein
MKTILALVGPIGCLLACRLAADGYELTNTTAGTPTQSLAGGGYTATAAATPSAPAGVSGGGYQGSVGAVNVSPAVAVVPGAATLFIARDGTNLVFTWADDGVVLESADNLNGTIRWQPVTPAPTGKTFATPADQPVRFFRLRNP